MQALHGVSSLSKKRGAGDVFNLATITPILKTGFRAVLTEALRLGVLDPPHGRTPMPDPNKITQQEIPNDLAEYSQSDDGESSRASVRVESCLPCVDPAAEIAQDVRDDDAESDDANLLEYHFNFGFNPLVFLGDYLRQNNPVAICARAKKRDLDQVFLQQQAARFLKKEVEMLQLRELVNLRRSGIVHGPIAGEITDTGARVWVEIFTSGSGIRERSRRNVFPIYCTVYKTPEQTLELGFMFWLGWVRPLNDNV